MDKASISMAMFNSFLYVYQREFKISSRHHHITETLEYMLYDVVGICCLNSYPQQKLPLSTVL